MSTNNKSSSRPLYLLAYAATARQINDELLSRAHTLQDYLANFESSCVEGAFRVNVGHLPGLLRSYAQNCVTNDIWVRNVALDFMKADAYAFVTSVLDSANAGSMLKFAQADKQFIDIIEYMSNHRGVMRATFLNIGRILNAGRKQGWVGKMEDLYSTFARSLPYRGAVDTIFRSRFSKFGLPGLDAVLGSYTDWQDKKYDGDVVKIIGVNGTNALVNFGIASTGYGAIALAVNAGIQLGTTVQIAVQHKIADMIARDETTRKLLHDDAERVEKSAKQMDLNNITKELSETVYDVYAAPYVETFRASKDELQQLWKEPSWKNLAALNTAVNEAFPPEKRVQYASAVLAPSTALLTSPKMREGVIDTIQATANVVTAIPSWSINTASSIGNIHITQSMNAVNDIPLLPDSWKQTFNTSAKKAMEWNSGAARKISSWLDI
jgi:hypothetical protein